MRDSESEFIQSLILKRFGGFSSKKQLIEELFIGSLTESYRRVDKVIGNENQIRDRFMKDLYQTDSQIKKWLHLNEINLSWENWVFTPDFELGRTDISFQTFGMKFILECKRLKRADKAYVDEGLERFINLKYAKGDEFAGMIGFVIGGDKHLISEGLQKKVDGLIHTQSIKKASPEPFFNSFHHRTDKSPIELYHLFFDFVIV